MKRTGLVLGLLLTVAVVAAAVSAQRAPEQSAKQLRALKDAHGTQNFWSKAAKPGPIRGVKVVVHARNFRPLTLDSPGLRAALDDAPREFTPAARTNPLVVSLPAPDGSFDRFALQESAIMAPGLARRHPGIKTYNGRGITDLTATIRADLTPARLPGLGSLGERGLVHRSVPRRPYAERVRELLRPVCRERRPREQRQGARVRWRLQGPRGRSRRRAISCGPIALALISDPGYSTYHGGPQNVTAAKVALLNRVNHIYEDDLTVRLQLIANNDLLNLDNYAEAIRAERALRRPPAVTPRPRFSVARPAASAS